MRKLGIMTSGGDAPGMNACIRAVTRIALQSGFEVYGIYDGYRGMVDDDIAPLSSLDVAGIIYRGGTILRTARLEEFKQVEYQEKAANNLKKHGIDTVVIIGGDGSFKGAQALDKFGINCLGIPGTIDNDLAYTDYTLGFDTAVNTALSAINNIRDTMTSHGRISIVEVMGHRCGEIALNSAVAGGAEAAIIPEHELNIDELADQLRYNKMHGRKSDIIILSEGVCKSNYLEKELEERLHVDIRSTTLGHIQRGGTPTMMDRVLAARFAYRAVQLALDGKTNRVIGIKNNQIIDMNIDEALALKKEISKELFEIEEILSR